MKYLVILAGLILAGACFAFAYINHVNEQNVENPAVEDNSMAKEDNSMAKIDKEAAEAKALAKRLEAEAKAKAEEKAKAKKIEEEALAAKRQADLDAAKANENSASDPVLAPEEAQKMLDNMEAPFIEGKLSPREVKDAIQKCESAMRLKCAGTGDLIVSFDILQSGNADNINARKGSLKDSEAEKCILDVLNNCPLVRFAQPKIIKEVKYTFKLGVN